MDYTSFITTDRPIPYKELVFYPITVKDYYEFLWCVECLLIDKNAIPDIQVISMPYFQFLFYLADNGEAIHLAKLLSLLVMTTKLQSDDFKIITDNGRSKLLVNNVEYDSNDFTNIKKIILLQNDIDDIDETIEKELRDELARAEILRAKMSGMKPATFEEQIICLMTALPGLSLDSIYDMPVRKFNRALKRADHKLHYEIYLSASMSGMVTFKDQNAIKHWMIGLEEDNKYKDVTMGVDELHNKVATEK